MKLISENLGLAIESALKAGEKIMEVYDYFDFNIKYKEDNSPLTIADKISNEIICENLKKTRIPILSEENEKVDYEIRKKWELFWLIDPLDGTKEFIKKNGEFTVNIALIYNQKPILGVVYAPALNTMYFAEIYFGAFKLIDCKSLDFKNSIDLSRKNPPTKFTVVKSKSHSNLETENFIRKLKKEEIRTLSIGSSLKICMIADRSANVYPRFGPTMEWDTAAAHAIALYSNCTIKAYNKRGTLIYNKENLENPKFIIKND